MMDAGEEPKLEKRDVPEKHIRPPSPQEGSSVK
jgi:hypothetical protein